MLYIVGFGLYSYRDITLRGLEIVKKSNRVYLEHYTSVHGESLEEFESLIGNEVCLASREMIEQTDKIIEEAEKQDVSLLVVGTPLFATTHTDIIIRAKDRGIRTEVIHNASILNVFGCCGLYSYAFGRTVSIPYFTDKWKPTSFYDNIVKNYQNGLHTLCLLDIQTDENRFMTVKEAVSQILEAARLCDSSVVNESTKVFAICRFGSPTEELTYESIKNIALRNYGDPLHSLVVPARLDTLQEEFVENMFR